MSCSRDDLTLLGLLPSATKMIGALPEHPHGMQNYVFQRFFSQNSFLFNSWVLCWGWFNSPTVLICCETWDILFYSLLLGHLSILFRFTEFIHNYAESSTYVWGSSSAGFKGNIMMKFAKMGEFVFTADVIKEIVAELWNQQFCCFLWCFFSLCPSPGSFFFFPVLGSSQHISWISSSPKFLVHARNFDMHGIVPWINLSLLWGVHEAEDSWSLVIIRYCDVDVP